MISVETFTTSCVVPRHTEVCEPTVCAADRVRCRPCALPAVLYTKSRFHAATKTNQLQDVNRMCRVLIVHFSPLWYSHQASRCTQPFSKVRMTTETASQENTCTPLRLRNMLKYSLDDWIVSAASVIDIPSTPT